MSAGLLEGTTVFEVGNGIAVAYGGRVLRSLGAQVWKLEALDDPDWVNTYGAPCPEHRTLSCAACHLNGAKVRFAVENAGDASSLQLMRELMERADLTISGTGVLASRLPEAIESRALDDASFIRIVDAVDGPPGIKVNADESAGVAAGLRDVYGDDQPPTGQRLDIAEVNAGTHLAATATLALSARELGNASPIRLDLGVYEAAFSMVEIAAQTTILYGLFGKDFADSITTPLRHPYLCRDGGLLVINLYGKEVWQRMCRAMERPEWSDDPRFVEQGGRGENAEELRQILDDWCITRDRDEAVARMRAEHIPAAPVQDLDDALKDEQVVARGVIAGDGAHSAGSIASCYVVNGERAPLPFVTIESAGDTFRGLNLKALTASATSSANAVLIAPI